MFDFDRNSPESILAYAKRLEGSTFLDVLKMYCEHKEVPLDDRLMADSTAKGQLGNFVEKYYFGYDPNSKQEADFKEAGVELKQTCIDVKKNGDLSAGERLSITNISFEEPVEPDFKKSHVWEKIAQILLVQYIRDKSIRRIDYQIKFVNLFTPPKEDLAIIMEDYQKIIGKIQAGKAHEISEGDTIYLGASTKGENAEKSTVPQYYGDRTPARKRNFCLKRKYMDYVLHKYVLNDAVPYERIIKDDLGTRDFEELVLGKIQEHVGKSDRQLCALLGRKYNNNKAQWVDLTYRMLGIKGNHAEEFEKANIDVRAIRLEENGKMRESISLSPFRFMELIEQEWDESDLNDQLSDTRFLFVIYKKRGSEYILRGARFWNMPFEDLEGEVREGWEAVRRTILNGVKFKINKNGTVSNDLLSKSENRIIHIRPHAKNASYSLDNGYIRGNVKRDGDILPDGQYMTRQSFWLNNDYILEQLHVMDMMKKNTKKETGLTADEILERLSYYYWMSGNPARKNNINRIAMSELISFWGFRYRMHGSPRSRDDKICMHVTQKGERLIYDQRTEHVTNDSGHLIEIPTMYIECEDGRVIKNIMLKDIWNLFYKVSEEDISLVACIVVVFYHLMCMTYHETRSIKMSYSDSRQDPNIEERIIKWSLPCFEDEVMTSLNESIGDIEIEGLGSISFEAFVYYWELEFIRSRFVVHNPKKKKDDKRLEIFVRMIDIAEYFMGLMTYGELLELVYEGDIESRYEPDRVERVTKGAVRPLSVDFFKALDDEGIRYRKGGIVHTGDTAYYLIAYIPDAKILIPRWKDEEAEEFFLEKGYKIIPIWDVTTPVLLKEKIRTLRSYL